MMYLYEFDKYEYISMHQNSIYNRIQEQGYISEKSPDWDVRYLTIDAIEESIKLLNDRKAKLLIWDMRRIETRAIHMMEDILIPIKKGAYEGICFLMDSNTSDLYNRINRELCNFEEKTEVYKCSNIGTTCLYSGKDSQYLIDYINGQDIFAVVDKDINKKICEWLESQEGKNTDEQGLDTEELDEEELDEEEPEEGWTKNYSSNTFVSQYFDARKALAEGSIYCLAIYRLALMIQESLIIFDTDSDKKGGKVVLKDAFDAFICASINGACLASGLSAIYHKPVIYLKNVGPRIAANDERVIARVKKHNRYVLVYDFMCLGKEYERMNMICNLHSAKIVCCAGVSYYRFPRFKIANPPEGDFVNTQFNWNKNLRMSALFHVNAFSEGDNYYSCRVEKEGK